MSRESENLGDEFKREYGRQMAATEALKEESEISPLYVTIDDSKVINMVQNPENPNNPFAALLPYFSHRHATTNLDLKQIRLHQLRVEIDFVMLEMHMDEDEYNTRFWAESDALKNYAKLIPNDSKGGWKMKELTLQRRRLTLETPEKKKKRRWGLF